MGQLTRNKLRLVHIEDNPDFAELCELHLRQAGFTQPVVHFSNGIDAVDYFLTLDPRSKPHAVLLDLHMPKMNGLEALRWLRYDYSEYDLAVYLLTSSDDQEHRREAAHARVTRYLLKTPTCSNLIAELDLLILRENHAEKRQVTEPGVGGNFGAGRLTNAIPALRTEKEKALRAP